MTGPLVSIVIPVYNGMPFLPDAVEAALAQDYERLEVVVIENGSTDGTAEWLREQSHDRLRVVFRPVTQVAADNWTESIAASIGDFVKLMCADDLISPDAITCQLADMQGNPGAVMAASRRRIIAADGSVIIASHGLGHLEGSVDGSRAVRECCLTGANLLGEPSAVLFDGPTIRSVMPWQSSWPYVIDLATYARVLESGSVVCNSAVLASFRVSPSSWSASLLGAQAHQFRSWRNEVVERGHVPFSTTDRLRSDASLRLRTVARRVIFAWVAHKAKRATRTGATR